MIYRILCNGYGGNACFGDIGNNGKPGCPRQRLMGAYVASAPANWSGLRYPHVSNRRLRFFFTEKGWKKIGRFIAAEASANERVVRVIRQKTPPASAVLYRDDLQVGILPQFAKRKLAQLKEGSNNRQWG